MTKRGLVEDLFLQRPSLSKEKVESLCKRNRCLFRGLCYDKKKSRWRTYVCKDPLCQRRKWRVFVRFTSVSLRSFVESLCRGLSECL